MDGISDLTLDFHAARQQTLKTQIGCVGTGLHSGRRVTLTLAPGLPDTGIVFRRTDLGIDIRASHDAVMSTRLCTQLAHPNNVHAHISTVEHVMAALAATGVDNAIVAVDGPEIPVFDGSAAPFLFLIDCAGRVSQLAARQVIEILRPVRITLGEAFAELRPGGTTLDMAMSIDFTASAIGRQSLSLSLSEQEFRSTLADARTFTMLSEIETMQTSGLALGGSLENAIVVDGNRVLNPGGLRTPDEFVRHKMLDAVGDLALAGAAIHGRFVAHRTGHTLNNRLLHALFADTKAWRMVSLEAAAWSSAGYGVTARAA